MQADDYFAIQALVHRYCLLIDRGDFAGVGALFAAADLQYADDGPVFRNDPAAIARMLSAFVRVYECGTPRTRHLSSNIIVEPLADGAAQATSAVTVLQAAPGLPLQPIICGRYDDRFAKQDGAWRFAARRFHADLSGDLSAHLLQPMPS